MRIRPIVFVIAAVLTGACAGAASAPKDAVLGEPLQLRVGESAAVRQTPLIVRFAGANDSRCPSDVVCVHAGDAMIILTFSGAGPDRTDTLYLAREPRSATYGAYRFDAVELQPYPKSSGAPAAQTLTIRVTSGP